MAEVEVNAVGLPPAFHGQACPSEPIRLKLRPQLRMVPLGTRGAARVPWGPSGTPDENQCAFAELMRGGAEGDPRTFSKPHSPATRLQLLMRPELASVIFAIGLLIGFPLGYGVRAFISYRRRQASRRRRFQ